MQKTWKRLALLAVALAILITVVTVAQATLAEPALVRGGAPTVVSYQGQVEVGGSPYHGEGYLKFVITNEKGSESFWSNDGTAGTDLEPKTTVPLQVTNGLFNVLLGDTSLQNMTEPLDAGVFEGTERYLRVWFSTDGRVFSQLTPDRRIASVPYALQAAEVPGYAGVIVVAKSGGDFAQIQAAVDSIVGESEESPYLVWVAPGLYQQAVTLKPFVHLQGAGREATIISSSVTNSADPPTQATVVLADDTSLRDLTVKNEGTGAHNVALLASLDNPQVEVANVSAEATGSTAASYYAIYVGGTWTHLRATDVEAYAAGNADNYALFCGANATLSGGLYRGRFGNNAYGVYHAGSELVTEGVKFEASNAADSYAFYNAGWRARLHGGKVDAKGGGDTWGIYNTNGAILEAQNLNLYSEGSLLVAAPSTHVRGLENEDGARALLWGGQYSAYGGADSTAGLYNVGTNTELEAYDVKARGGSSASYDRNYGLYSSSGASSLLRGGSYLADGGQRTRGIAIEVADTTLDAHGITVEAHDGTSENYGLLANPGSAADVRSSSLVGATALKMNTSTVNLALTQVADTIDRTGGTLTCYGVYDGSYSGIPCP